MNETLKTTTDQNQQIKKTIRIAILATEPFFWQSRKFYHKKILGNYSWTVENITYTFNAQYIYDTDIIAGKLTKSNFDLLLVPGGGVGNNEALTKGLTFRGSVRKFKKNIANFIKDGGGYMGFCGGVALMTNLSKGDDIKLTSLTERLYNKSSLDVSCVTSYFSNVAFPLFNNFQNHYPEKIGNSAYAFSFAPGQTTDGKYFIAIGAPLDIQINKDNPIFSDFTEKTNRMRWWAGQALITPKKPDRELYILARYPQHDVSENESTKIHAWKYKGGISGLVVAFLKAFKFAIKHNFSLKSVPLFAFYLAGNWEPTDRVVNLNQGNKPCITAEIYPNENKGRILLSTVHPEYMVWRGGHIENNNGKGFHCIGSGFYRWKAVQPLSDSLREELTHNWWILRRFAAWATKVPDNHLPPKELGEITDEIKALIKEKILWDGTFVGQMKSI